MKIQSKIYWKYEKTSFMNDWKEWYFNLFKRILFIFTTRFRKIDKYNEYELIIKFLTK